MARKAQNKGAGNWSIGQAVALLKPEFPDLSISKVRYLEDEGLLKLGRTKGGYRLFAKEDIGRLSEILRLQKEQFLPLVVIKERMVDWRGPVEAEKPAAGGNGDKGDTETGPRTLQEVLGKTALSTEVIKAMDGFGLIKLIEHEDGLLLGPEDAEILQIFADLSRFGIEPRHIRMYENQAQRESLLFQQILTPHLRHKSAKLRGESQDALRELIGLTQRIKGLILQKALKDVNLLDK
jgi:DNA-binding transcriptional MerR regulator